MRIVCDGFSSSGESNRHSSTLVACSENRAKLTPAPSKVAPGGYDCPGQTRMGVSSGWTMVTVTGGRVRAESPCNQCTESGNDRVGMTESVRHHPDFHSEHLGNARTLSVYLPPGYGDDPARRHPVFYLQ